MTEKVDIIRPTSNVQRPTSNVQRNLFPKTITIFLKMFVSGVLALFILTLLCKFYFNLPLNFADPSGATDKKRELNAYFAYCLEGFSYGRINNEGRNDSIYYEEGMPLNILVMGSSHMEAFEVMRKDNTASLLAKFSDKIVYNIGMSAHRFITCAMNLETALKRYTPYDYVVIETAALNFSDDDLEGIINKSIPKIPESKFRAYNKGFMYMLRRNDFLRLMNVQFKIGGAENPSNENVSVSNTSNNAELLSEVLMQLNETAQSYGVKLIIAYHPSITLNKDGTISINGNPDITAQFSELCAQNGIYFVDTGKRFLDEYAKDYTLPYGFMNTSVAKGHMNKYGHRMFAEEIYKLIQRIEAQS